jgi:hypothetical protein
MDMYTIILVVLLAVSEGLSLIPCFKSNGIFQFIWNILKKLAGKKVALFWIGMFALVIAVDLYTGVLMGTSGILFASFTLVGFSETVASEDTTELLNAIPDQHVKTSGDDIIVPELNKLMGYYAIGDTIYAPQLASPSLRSMALIDISPYELTDLPVFPPDPIIKGESLIELDEDESLNAYAQNSEAADAVCRVLVWLSDDAVGMVSGAIHTIKATTTITATAEQWSAGSLTLGQSLPTGTYQIVGARCVDAAGVAFRFVFIGGKWRPGFVCVASEDTHDCKYSRYGMMGVWGSFRHDQVPSIEVLRNAAGGTATIYLDIIKTG